MRGPQEFKGIVLFNRNYREKDKLVKIFTESFGKRMFFVKRANQTNSAIRSSIQPFTTAQYIGQINDEGLCFLNASKSTTPFFNIQQDIFLSAYATYLLNLSDSCIDDGVYDPMLFGFLNQTLTLIDKGYDAEILTAIFEIQLLNRFGVEFNWKSCAICGQTQGKFDFSNHYHGVLCEQHWNYDPNRYHFNPVAVHFIRWFSHIQLDRIQSIKVSSETRQLIRQTLDGLYDEYVGLHLKSKKFIEDMIKWENMLPKKEDKN